MRFWFIHSSEVTIREQIVTQVRLAILCGDLSPGDRLPSTRDLGRRFRLHPNTVSAAYRQLESEGWVESRKGSGVYIGTTRPSHEVRTDATALDHLFEGFLRSAKTIGIPEQQIRTYLRRWVDVPVPTSFLLIEPEDSLAAIVMEEIAEAVGSPISHCSPTDDRLMEKVRSALVLVLPSKAEVVKSLLPSEVGIMTLNVRSVASSLSGWLPVSPDALVAIASGWPPFLDIAKTLLLSAGFSGDALVLRQTSDTSWKKGLDHVSAVVCDIRTARMLPPTTRTICFSLLADETLADLQLVAATMTTRSA